ncbi:helix-turn-helix transcriptional regulator [Siphonobacter sp. SORGH_AS_0500]|uniref:helix-turn-helix domain-containing protein n=1 Tax=Siphonobacter sp. SORGH_AS_0500 TaxID=1864824 RepID=UPI002860ADBF|nr:helix-turn-helix transcriptional regulator [Siphonobacter sp. SORGH_AS_0500]MDR6197096.1 transcriptional regulator with XRE-family HTH domain [Siphonobacter sp. SORGH_AS_0500]
MSSDNSVLVSFGKKVRLLRSQAKMSQEDLAFRAGLHRTYIGMIERAEKNITLINIEKIANALNINITELFYGEEQLPTEDQNSITS